MTEPPSVEEVVRVAQFRAGLRRFLRRSERVARSSGLTPQRYLLLLMIKGAPEGDEQSTVTELAERLQLAQSTVTELVSRAEEVGLIGREQSASEHLHCDCRRKCCKRADMRPSPLKGAQVWPM